MTGIAICGVGKIGMVHLTNLQRLRGCRLTGVYDSSQTTLDLVRDSTEVRCFSSYEAILDDQHTDAVVIATPSRTHRELTVEALRSGKHVFLEKPIAGTQEDALAIVEAAGQARRCVQIGFCERFNPQYIEAKRCVRDSALGKLRAIYTSRVAPFWLGDPGWELGIFDTAVHNIDLVLWLFQQIPETVLAVGTTLYPNAPMPHSAVIVLSFQSGAIATDHITWLRDEGHPLHQCARSRMQILGEEGTFEVDLSGRPAWLLNRQGFRMPDTVILGNTEYPGCLTLQFEAFLRSIEDGTPAAVTAQDAWNAERVVLAARESLLAGKKISLT